MASCSKVVPMRSTAPPIPTSRRFACSWSVISWFRHCSTTPWAPVATVQGVLPVAVHGRALRLHPGLQGSNCLEGHLQDGAQGYGHGGPWGCMDHSRGHVHGPLVTARGGRGSLQWVGVQGYEVTMAGWGLGALQQVGVCGQQPGVPQPRPCPAQPDARNT